MPSKKVFIWKDYAKWRPVALRIMGEYLDKDVIARLRAYPPRHFVADHLDWLDDAVQRVKGYRPDTKTHLADGLKKHYQFNRAYHGCRPVSLDTYRDKGIVRSNVEELQAIARKIFTNQRRLKRILHLATDGSYTYEEDVRGLVYFSLDEDDLINCCSHYLRKGERVSSMHRESHWRGSDFATKGNSYQYPVQHPNSRCWPCSACAPYTAEGPHCKICYSVLNLMIFN